MQLSFGLRLCASALACAALLASASPARADLDLSALAARVDAALADPGLEPSLRPHYAALDKALAKRDRTGLADDFSKLERAALACEGDLGGDAALVGALDVALAAGLTGDLPAEDLAVARVAALVTSAPARRSVDANLRAARLTRDDAADAQDHGVAAAACRAAARSAVRYARARRAAEGAVHRQDRRPARWKVVLDGRAGALLSVHVEPGLAPDVYVVGRHDEDGTQLLRGGGEGWVRIAAGDADTLWWVTGVPGGGIWACGTDGHVVRYDPATGAVGDVSTGAAGATSTLYGVWGAGPDDVWTVGDGSPAGHVVLHWDGAGWTSVATPPEADGREIYKVWGRATDDVWACGAGGLLLHWDGTTWASVPSGTATTLLTVHGAGTRVTAVGQVLGAAIVERGAAGAFVPARVPPSVGSVAGVFVPARGDAWAAGYTGTVLRRSRGNWREVTDVPGTQGRDLHGVAIDDSGGVWIVGGDVVPRLDDGVLLYHGPRTPASDVVRRASFRSRVQPVLAANCVEFGCHGGLSPAQFDATTPEASLAGLVGAPSDQSRLLRVLPGRPSESYLVHKLDGTQGTAGGSGETMPQGRDPLTSSDVEAIRAWILEGAPDSE